MEETCRGERMTLPMLVLLLSTAIAFGPIERTYCGDRALVITQVNTEMKGFCESTDRGSKRPGTASPGSGDLDTSCGVKIVYHE